jgi:hypothetical protein
MLAYGLLPSHLKQNAVAAQFIPKFQAQLFTALSGTAPRDAQTWPPQKRQLSIATSYGSLYGSPLNHDFSADC